MVTTRATGITAAAGTRLPRPYSPCHLKTWQKFLLKKKKHLGSPYHTFVHCRVFGTAARRSARVLVSVPFSGLMLPHPLRVIGMVGRYPAICLIRRSPIIKWKRSNLRPFRLTLLPDALAYGVLTPVSRGYSPLYGKLTTCY